MKVIPTNIPDVIIIQPNIYKDHRGYFFEPYNKNTFETIRITHQFVQDNQSLSKKDVIRGLHFQKPPYAQAKLVRVVCGSVLDVAVDIRKNSPSYGQYAIVKLTAEENNMLWIPEGFAHGFAALEDNTILSYKTSNYYNKESEETLLWSDKTLNIPWNISNPIISEKDEEAILFKDFISPF